MSQPGVSGVHIAGAGGSGKDEKRRAKLYAEIARRNLGLDKSDSDIVTLDIPLLIRLMEFAREDARSDLDLHDAAENMADIGGVLRMADYDRIVGPAGAAAVEKRYASISELPSAVRSRLKGDETKLRQWMHVFNSSLDRHKDEGRAFAEAWSTVQRDAVTKYEMHDNGDGTAKTPFVYDINALGSLRPDQVPRFFGALTNPESLPETTVDLPSLVAMQDRVDPEKVEAIRNRRGGRMKLPVVVRHNSQNYIADGHHRLAAQLLDGKTEAKVRLKDLTEHNPALKRHEPLIAASAVEARVVKVDESLGIVFGWAIVCNENGVPYWDVQKNHIPEASMLEAAADFAENSRAGNEMHAGPDRGEYLFCFPLTADIAKAMGVHSPVTGLMVGYKPPPDVLAKFASGEYTGFSIEGEHLELEPLP